MIFLAVPSLLSGGVDTWGTAGSETLRAMLATEGALEMTVGADGTTVCFAMDGVVRALATLLLSRKFSDTVRCHVITLLW